MRRCGIFFCNRNAVGDRNWIAASNSSGFLSFFFFNLFEVSWTEFFPCHPKSCCEMCHCGIWTVLSLRQKSLASIDSYRQLSTNIDRVPDTGRWKHSQPVPYCCRHHVIIYVPLYISDFRFIYLAWGHALAQLVEALRYKPAGRGFDSRWCHWNFSST